LEEIFTLLITFLMANDFEETFIINCIIYISLYLAYFVNIKKAKDLN